VHGLGSFYFWLPRFADQLLDRWHSGSFPVSLSIVLHTTCVHLLL
jgi:hypothetical protein